MTKIIQAMHIPMAAKIPVANEIGVVNPQLMMVMEGVPEGGFFTMGSVRQKCHHDNILLT